MRRLSTLAALIGAALLASASASAQVVIVRARPPAMRREVRVVRPSGQHVWIGGYHHWNGAHWEWTPGRWEVPSRPRARWIPPQYIRTREGVRYIPGHWS